MCGIAGIAGSVNNGETLMGRMLESMKHRGPDYRGVWTDSNIVLGHNRLSIIDLSEQANQPMHSIDGRYTLVYNGEIYNYKELKDDLKKVYPFKTQSDSEVLLYAYIYWGTDCLNHLNGMFSFAIWDNQEKKLFAARDRFGVKPFFYSVHNDNLIFASEIKGLFAYGIEKVPDEETWLRYLKYGTYGLYGKSFWKEIKELKAGHFLEYEKGKLKIRRWYDFIGNVGKVHKYDNYDSLAADYVELLKDAVSLRFRSDVPVGFNLSGGLDSSILLAMVHHLFPEDPHISAFTFYSDDERYDELPWVQSMIDNTNKPLVKCLLTPEDVAENIKLFCHHQDEPYGGLPTIAYSNIFREARKRGIIVLLDGQGMDEAWAGYDYYNKQGEIYVQGTNQSPTRPNTLKKGLRESVNGLSYEKVFNDDLLDKQYRDIVYTKFPRLLRFSDRFSMMHSTELREPFLDHRLVEFAFAQNREMKIRNGEHKWALRRIASEYLPDNVVFAPKRALQTPQREWMSNGLRPLVEESLTMLCDNPWFEADQLKKEWSDYLDGKSDNSFYVWQWINTKQLLS